MCALQCCISWSGKASIVHKAKRTVKPTLLVLAAGIGSRYGGLKQVDGIGPHGEAIIDYSVYDAIRAGFGKVVFVIRHSIEEAFKEKFGGKFDSKIKVEYAFQEIDTPVEGIHSWPADRQKPWGTGHAILSAARHIEEPFLAINADDYYGPTAFSAISEFLQHSCTPESYAMVGYRLSNTLSEHGTVSRGVCEVDESGHLTNVVERTKINRGEDERIFYTDETGAFVLDPRAYVSLNVWGMHPNVFEHLRRQFVEFYQQNSNNPKSEFYIPFAINELVQSGLVKVSVLPTEEQWYGVTYQEDKDIVQQAFVAKTKQGIYPDTALFGAL